MKVKMENEEKKVRNQKIAEELIKIVAAYKELDDNFAKKLTMLPEYLEMDQSDIKADLDRRASELLVEQKEQYKRENLVHSSIYRENIDLKLKDRIPMDAFDDDISSKIPIEEIIEKVHLKAESLKNKED